MQVLMSHTYYQNQCVKHIDLSGRPVIPFFLCLSYLSQRSYFTNVILLYM